MRGVNLPKVSRLYDFWDSRDVRGNQRDFISLRCAWSVSLKGVSYIIRLNDMIEAMNIHTKFFGLGSS